MVTKRRKMKPAQLPIYRAVEALFIWLIPVLERLPKAETYKVLTGYIVRDVCECMDAIVLAHGLDKSSANYDLARKECFGVLVARMTGLKTKMRVLQQCRIKVKDAEGNTRLAPVFSPKQEAKFLDLVNPIAVQAGAWLAARPKDESHNIEIPD